jgi:hypothetical protein
VIGLLLSLVVALLLWIVLVPLFWSVRWLFRGWAPHDATRSQP